MEQAERDALWSSERPVPGAAFALNDPVVVTRGGCAGQPAAVLALLEVGTDPLYLVEFGKTGAEAELRESCLRAA